MATAPGEAVSSRGWLGWHSPGRGALQAIRIVVIKSASTAGALGAQGWVGIAPLLAGAWFSARGGGSLGLGLPKAASPGMQDLGAVATPREPPPKTAGVL